MGQAKHTNVVQINGKLYNVADGKVVQRAKAASPQHHSRVIDGFRRVPSARRTAQAPAARSMPKPSSHRTSTVAAKHVHHGAKKTQTLARSAIRKPAPQRLKAVTVPHKGAPESIAPGALVLRSDTQRRRLQHARQAHRSAKIRKFTDQAHKATAQPLDYTVSQAVISQPVVAGGPVIPQTNTWPFSPEQLVADAHQHPKKRRNTLLRRAARRLSERPKTVTAVASVLSALIIGGYVTYLNVPNMTMRLAASRAGFNADVPGYSPTGFRFAGPVAYGPGHITLKYASNSDDREFRIVQQESGWDSQAVLDNHVARQAEQYLTFHERGLTIYVYNGNQASWVNGGIWYTIEGDSLLNTEQLIKIAASL